MADTEYIKTGGAGQPQQWWGVYYGYIAVNQDPTDAGRVRLRVPQVFGGATSGWAPPMVPVPYIPQVGTQVTVMFVGGDPTQPVWSGNFALPGTQEVTTGTGPPNPDPVPAPPLGTIYYQLGVGGVVTAIFEWNGAGWVDYFIGGGAIATSTTITEPFLVAPTILGFAGIERGPYTESFETGTGGWTADNGALTQDATWASDGVDSLLLTASASGAMDAFSPKQEVDAGGPVAVSVDLFNPGGSSLANVYVGVRYFDVNGTQISETDSTAAALAATTMTTIEVLDNAPALAAGDSADAASFAFYAGDSTSGGASGRKLNIDNIQSSGNLAFSAAVMAGTTAAGNTYDSGIEINGLPGLTNAFSVDDPFGNTLAGIDGQGNIQGQTVSATTDMFIGGMSLLNSLLPNLPGGLVARTNVLASSLPAPGSPTTSEFYLYELDVQAVAGRSYLIVLEPVFIALSGAGKVRLTVYATTDGSQPTNSSNILCFTDMTYPGATANLNVASATLTHPFESSAGALWRLLVSVNSISTGGGGAPSMQLSQVDTNPGDDGASNANARMSVYDMGSTLPNTGRSILATASGSGGGTRNFVSTYNATGSWSYSGSDGHFPNSLLNHNGKMYQGGDSGATFNGHAKSWIIFPASAIASDLSGATINSTSLYLNNNHTWYDSGGFAAIGWDTKTSFGSTASDPSGSNIDQHNVFFSEGQSQWVSVGGLGLAFQSGSAKNVVLYRGTNNLQDYAIFAGAGQSGAPRLRISYTK